MKTACSDWPTLAVHGNPTRKRGESASALTYALGFNVNCHAGMHPLKMDGPLVRRVFDARRHSAKNSHRWHVRHDRHHDQIFSAPHTCNSLASRVSFPIAARVAVRQRVNWQFVFPRFRPIPHGNNSIACPGRNRQPLRSLMCNAGPLVRNASRRFRRWALR